MNIAQERDFYKLRDLTREEIKFLEGFCNGQRDPLRTTNLRWVKYFTAIFDLQRALLAKGLPAEEVMRLIDEAAIEQEEELHGRIEQEAMVVLEALLVGDASFFKIPGERTKFFYFLCVQYTRTKKLKANALEGPRKLTAVKPDNIWNALSHIIATSLGQSLIAYSYQLYFLRPGGEGVFITGDQPVINLHGTYLAPAETPRELELYYPISPKLAVLITTGPPANSNLTDEEVGDYNQHIQIQSHSQLFAHSASVLKAFVKT